MIRYFIYNLRQFYQTLKREAFKANINWKESYYIEECKTKFSRVRNIYLIDNVF